MLKRFRQMLGGAKGDAAERTLHPLCRLRHATLHPGATLLTPGVGGGSLGEGAARALDEVGVGGELVVGFQSAAREPLHDVGVLALVEAVVPFPEDWDPAGLGAERRYRLRGLRRVQLDLDSCTTRRVPTVMVTPASDEPDDAAPAPDELLSLLTALSEVDNNWPDYWLEAFECLPDAPLAQWATTLGWRIAKQDRLALFDQPLKIAETVFATLDSLHLGLTPQRRREAVRLQTLTRRTTMMPERVVVVESDAAGWALFHPSDMTLNGDANGATQAGPDAIATHLALGNFVAVKTPTRAVHRVRLTGGGLSERERRALRSEAVFRLYVRHGRLFIGGLQLATGNHFEDNLAYADPKRWIDVPNGLFRVCVSALHPELGPAPDGQAPLPQYVVRLSEADALDQVSAPSAVPAL